VGFHGGYGVYHSIYDNFNWMEKFGDPEFLNHATAARLYTAIIMRAAAADVAPLKFVPYAMALREYVDELRLVHLKRVRKAESATSDSDVEFAGLATLVDAVRGFRSQAEKLDQATSALTQRDQVDKTSLSRLNDLLAQVERSFLLERGLPERSWFKHAIYAPGLTTGYASWPLPAIRQALEDKSKEHLAAYLPPTVERIRKATGALEAACKHAEAMLAAH
jgi:N-acetylated-alpha-linked acidic dipeptidase